jgi:ligand-binding SRPBCC domain-containing protein
MADHVMESRLWLARPRPDVFAFLADPANLARVMPRSFHVRLLTPGVTMQAGAVVDFRIAWLGLPLRWRMFVREWDPPYRFVDVQVSGPYARWEHRHRLLEEGGGTWIEDRVTYRLPFGRLGGALHALLVAQQLRAAWVYRRERLIEMLAPVSARAG